MHTPGEWHAVVDRFGASVLDGKGRVIAEIKSPKGYAVRPGIAARARLFAASPELLKALKALDAWISAPSGSADRSEELIRQMRAAISKAEGRDGC